MRAAVWSSEKAKDFFRDRAKSKTGVVRSSTFSKPTYLTPPTQQMNIPSPDQRKTCFFISLNPCDVSLREVVYQ
jgi:hypothetical protein